MCFDSLMKNLNNCLLADYSSWALLIIPANPLKILWPSGISVLSSSVPFKSEDLNWLPTGPLCSSLLHASQSFSSHLLSDQLP